MQDMKDSRKSEKEGRDSESASSCLSLSSPYAARWSRALLGVS